jgi:hypothetical protein
VSPQNGKGKHSLSPGTDSKYPSSAVG